MKNPHADLIERLAKLAKNLWWSWNYEAVSLFTSVDPPLFAATNQNPIRTLKLLAPHQIAAIECDADFCASGIRRKTIVPISVCPHLVRIDCTENRPQAEDRVLLRRIRHTRIAATIFRRPGRARGRSRQIGF